MTLTKTTILLALLATPALGADPAPQKDQTQLRDRVRDPATHPDGTVTPAQDRARDRIREHSQAAAQERSRDRSREMSQARAHEQARSAGGMGQGGATGGGSGFRGGK
jgi:hypothetical protein